ncbi:MAG: Uncharacterised protein [Pseudidiomarina mangrovi]|nr:MAG: Uncharacterised protein [Pseudidiomarina mangrovi]
MWQLFGTNTAMKGYRFQFFSNNRLLFKLLGRVDKRFIQPFDAKITLVCPTVIIGQNSQGTITGADVDDFRSSRHRGKLVVPKLF